MPGERFKAFVHSCGLEAEDVPKVAASFVACKYAGWGACLYLSVRYQPLRRLFLAKSKALPWAQRQSLRILEHWDRAKRHPPLHRLAPGRLPAAASESALPSGSSTSSSGLGRGGTVKGPLGRRRHSAQAVPGPSQVASRASARRSLLSEKRQLQFREAGRRMRGRFSEALDAARRRYSSAQDRYKFVRDAGRERWRNAGRKLMLFKQLQMNRHAHFRVATKSWYSWISARYWRLADKLETAAANNMTWRTLSINLGLAPKGFAVGIAEGTILYKVTFPLTAPVTLCVIMQFFKRRHRVVLADTASQDGDASAAPSAGRPKPAEQAWHSTGLCGG
mmetsp:Transcript_161359/g.286096  ORF Transcript_161359/g.286096 Transcript_161359/m.286096 type:complete len:335 (-) Transcript_161359:116-1120(-)